MTDAELAEKAKRQLEYDAKAKRYGARAAKLKGEVVKEMERRKTKGIETGGYRVTYVKQQSTVYDPVRLRRALGPELWAECQQEVFSRDLLAGLVAEGKVSVRKVERCTSIEDKAAYVVITPAK